MRQFLLTLAVCWLAGGAQADYNTPNDWQPSTLSSTCAVKPLPWFTKAEAWAWEQVCLDRLAYMASVDEDDPRSGCHVAPEHASPYGNKLSARFLQVVNTNKRFTEALPVGIVGFYCGQVDDILTLAYTEVPHGVTFYGFEFSQKVDLTGATVSGNLSFTKSQFAQSLFLKEARVARSVILSQTSMHDLNAVRAEVDGGFFMREISAARIMLFQAEIKHDLDLLDAEFDSLRFQSAKIGGDIKLFGAEGHEVYGLDADIGGSLFADGARFYKLAVERAQIGESVHLRQRTGKGIANQAGVFGRINFNGAEIGDSLQLQGSFFTGRVSLRGAVIRRQLVLIQNRRVPIWHADKDAGFAPALDMARARVGTLRARIPESFIMPIEDQGEIAEICEEEETQSDDPTAPVVMILSNCRPDLKAYERYNGGPFVAKLVAEGAYKYVPLEIGGLTYGALDEDKTRVQQRSTSLSPLSLAKWAQRESIYIDEGGFERVGVLRTQPYEQAISYLEAQGEGMKANQLRFWKNWHRTKAQIASGWGAPVGLASLLWLGLTIYGIVPAVAFIWFALLVLWGMRLARASAGFPGEAQKTRYDRFWFSLENALPLLELSETHKQIIHGDRGVEQKFLMQKVLGFILASVLVGALALI